MATNNHTLYFYNPEANINNYSRLKLGFDRYLEQFGQYQFQPVSERLQFNDMVNNNDQGLLLLSSEHYQRLKQKRPSLTPLLIGVNRGNTMGYKILVVKNQLKSLEQLNKVKIAIAGQKQYAQDSLTQLLQNQKTKKIINQFELLSVPKDIDALMLVNFGMAQAALVADSSLQKLQRVNPAQAKQLRVLIQGQHYLLPIIAANQPLANQEQALLGLVQKMALNEQGLRQLKMIGLEQFQTLSSKELEQLQ